MEKITEESSSYIKKVHKYFFYVFIFTLPWSTIWILREIFYNNEKWQYGTIGIYISDLALIVWIIISIYIYKDAIIEYCLKRQKLFISGLLLSLWGFISIIWADDKALALYFALKLSFSLDLFFLILVTPFNIRVTGLIFVFSAFLQSVLGLYQFVFQKTFTFKLLGLNAHNIWHGSTAIITTEGERWLRAYGGMPHPNIFGGLLLCALLISIYIYIKTKKGTSLSRIFLLTSIIVFTVNILFTFSRATWVSFIFIMTTILICTHLKQKNVFKKLLVPILLIFTTTAIVIFLYSNLFITRTAQDTVPRHNSFTDRTVYINQAKQLISQNPIIGTGLNNYTNKIYSQENIMIWDAQPVHNIYYLITAEIGTVGLILFCLFFSIILYNIYAQRKNLSLLQCFFSILLVTFFLMSLGDHWLWTSHFGLILLFLIASLTQKSHYFVK